MVNLDLNYDKKDLYGMLDIDRSASAAQIKKAYRKLVKKYHPDYNTHENADAVFRDLTLAYQILSDETKRANYDKYGYDGINGPTIENVLQEVDDIFNNSRITDDDLEEILASEKRSKKKKKHRKSILDEMADVGMVSETPTFDKKKREIHEQKTKEKPKEQHVESTQEVEENVEQPSAPEPTEQATAEVSDSHRGGLFGWIKKKKLKKQMMAQSVSDATVEVLAIPETIPPQPVVEKEHQTFTQAKVFSRPGTTATTAVKTKVSAPVNPNVNQNVPKDTKQATTTTVTPPPPAPASKVSEPTKPIVNNVSDNKASNTAPTNTGTGKTTTSNSSFVSSGQASSTQNKTPTTVSEKDKVVAKEVPKETKDKMSNSTPNIEKSTEEKIIIPVTQNNKDNVVQSQPKQANNAAPVNKGSGPATDKANTTPISANDAAKNNVEQQKTQESKTEEVKSPERTEIVEYDLHSMKYNNIEVPDSSYEQSKAKSFLSEKFNTVKFKTTESNSYCEEDIVFKIQVPQLVMYVGATKNFFYARKVRCHSCDGAKVTDMNQPRCTSCGGLGVIDEKMEISVELPVTNEKSISKRYVGFGNINVENNIVGDLIINFVASQENEYFWADDEGNLYTVIYIDGLKMCMTNFIRIHTLNGMKKIAVKEINTDERIVIKDCGLKEHYSEKMRKTLPVGKLIVDVIFEFYSYNVDSNTTVSEMIKLRNPRVAEYEKGIERDLKKMTRFITKILSWNEVIDGSDVDDEWLVV